MISHQRAKALADAHLRARGSDLVAVHAARRAPWPAWVVSYADPAAPGEVLDGGALVVTDAGEVHGVSSVPGAVEDLLLGLGLATDTDEEALLLLADEDPAEAAALRGERRR